MSKTALIYTRISKDDNGDQLGVDRQERLCRQLADQEGLDVVDVLTDNDISAYKSRRRPAWERLVELLRERTVDAVLAYHVDRLYRRAPDLERLVGAVEGSGVKVRTVSAGDIDLNTASGRMVARMLAGAAQGEVERLSERLRDKMDELAASGKAPGGKPPWGYSRDDSRGYVVNRAEAKALRFMADRVLEGASLLSVARELDAKGVSTREGRGWHHSTVRAVLINPAVAGLRVHRREIAGVGEWEPIFDRAEWEQIRAVLTDPARKRKRPVREYLLTGLIETAAGDPMIGRPDRERRTYATRTPAKQHAQVAADELEEIVVEAVLSVMDDTALPVPDEGDSEGGAEVAAIESELAELATIRGKGKISLAEWMAAREPLLQRLDAAKSAAGATRRPSKEMHLLAKPGALRRQWPKLPLVARREILSTVLERVVVGPAFNGRHTPVADRLDPNNGGNLVWRG